MMHGQENIKFCTEN